MTAGRRVNFPRRISGDKFRFQAISRRRTALYGVVGRPIGHSLSPAMHNAAFAAEGFDAVYLPLEAADAEDFLTFAPRGRRAGRQRDGAVQGDARAARAARRRGTAGWRAEHPDSATATRGGRPTPTWKGSSPRSGRDDRCRDPRVRPRRRRGGARRGAGLSREGATVTMHARRREQAEHVAESLRVAVGAGRPPQGRGTCWSTPRRSAPRPRVDETPWPDARFDGRLVYDLVYNPRETRLLREAAAAGCDTLGGLDMLVAQAQQQFQLWTGRLSDAAVMRAPPSASCDAVQGPREGASRRPAQAPAHGPSAFR